MLIHQLPPKPPYLRVKIWRRLQAIGAVPIKNSVYVLPNRDDTREDFEWIVRDVRARGGDASICEARLLEGLTDAQVRASFHDAREADYRAVAEEARVLARTATPRRARRLAADARAQVEAGVARLRKRLAEIAEIDFFAAPGREAAEGLLRGLERGLDDAPPTAPATAARRVSDVQGRVWVTRSGIRVDRIASAWLIRRFIDPAARFRFVAAQRHRPAKGEIRFDMFDAELTHDGDLCTFEVLVRDFALADPALRAIAEVVHDIDVKDGRFGRLETPGVDRVIAGIAAAGVDDETRLARGTVLFDALHAAFGAARS